MQEEIDSAIEDLDQGKGGPSQENERNVLAMVQKVIWSPLAVQTYVSNIEYLQKEWIQGDRQIYCCNWKKIKFAETPTGHRSHNT